MNMNEKKLESLTGTIRAFQKFNLTNTSEYEALLKEREELLNVLQAR